MSLIKHLVTLERDELVDVYRHWAGNVGVPTGHDDLVKQELIRLMTDRDRVLQRYRELPVRCRDFLKWMLDQEEFAVPLSRLDQDGLELPVKGFEVEAVAYALKKRGFLAETRNLSWMSYDEPVYIIPGDLGETLAVALGSSDRSLDTSLRLRSFLRTVKRAEIARRLADLGLPEHLVDDRAALVQELSRPETLIRVIEGLPDKGLRAVVERVLYDHGGIGEIRHLERLGYPISDIRGWRQMLEHALLGTLMDGDLTDVGLQLGSGSLIVFLDLVRGFLVPQVEVAADEEPEPPADVLADLSTIRTFIDHHSVRVTRDGTLYRATRRKMEVELLSPGSRPLGAEETVSWLLDFLTDAELVKPGDDGRMRTTRAWEAFDAKGPVERTELLLTYVQNDMRDTRGTYHLPRLRRLLLAECRDAGPGRWLRIRPLTILARNRYLLGLDRATAADRFQKRYKYAPLPPLASPAVLTRELLRFVTEAVPLAGVVQVLVVEEQPVAVRMTRVGAAVLGLPLEEQGGPVEGSLVVTADFEVVLFPDAGGIELVHEVSRFARREKADYSLHYRISERSIQEAVAGGLDADGILSTLRRHGRHDVPQNVEASVRGWAAGVRVLSARRTLLLRAPSKEALDAALKVKELGAIALERLTDTVLEVSEDPSTPRVAEALRLQGFFLR
jgi:hypothetical protein